MKVADPELLARLNGEEEEEESPKLTSKVTDPKILALLEAEQKVSAPVPTPEPELEEGSFIGDLARVSGTIASSVLSEPVAGLSGLATWAFSGGDSERAAEAVESARDSLTYIPETEGSQEMLQGIGETLAPLAEGFETVSSSLGDTALEWTGSPELATVFYSLPTAALELAGLGALKKGARISEAGLRSAQKAALTDPKMKYSPSVADVKIGKNGDVVPDKVAERLIKNDLPRGDVALITNTDLSTKAGMSKMAAEFDKAKGNLVESMEGKTTAVIGESIGRRLKAAQGMRKRLGRKLDGMVKGDLGNTSVNIKDAVNTAVQTLKAQGVSPVISRGKITLPKDWAKGTVFGLPQMTGARKAMESALELVDMRSGYGGATNLRQAHKLKKDLDDLVDATKLDDSGVIGKTSRAIAEMRRTVNEAVGQQVPKYGEVNSELSSLIRGMEPFNKHLRPGETWGDARVSSVAGQAAKGLEAETITSKSLINDLNALDGALRASRIIPTDDPKALVAFRDVLNRNFKIEPSVPSAGAGDAAIGLATSASVNNVFGAAHDVKRLIEAGMSKKQAAAMAEKNRKSFELIRAALKAPSQ